jgi:hypothetical protein
MGGIKIIGGLVIKTISKVWGTDMVGGVISGVC